ncbi:isochorismate synthase 2, chloroplastic [Phoenix dactylifera]|uniref:isochorismate synthase n=1 Tax=Phoenix dactylifera TaxID=42345 RepID=A0A8B8ZLM9_PHODC|nr:isochorismate synthase 2, chloroplastic [Phoenix dactylifera]
MLALNIAWDNTLLWTWKKAINGVQATMHQITPCFGGLRKLVPRTAIIGFNHVPTRTSWDISVKKALQIIKGRNSELVKVVLARCSRYVTDTSIDPVSLLACLQQVEGQNAYQFFIQPPDAPAFIGNTPEKLFHRKYSNITSTSPELIADSKPGSSLKTFHKKIKHSTKDNNEFTIVRESIRRKMEITCSEVLVEPSKALRKLPRVQHLSAELSGKLRNEDDEFDILTSLHPSPAVCGLPTEEARRFIEEIEMFDRGMYAGPVGWFGGRESEFAVGIRSALVGKGVGTLVYAGAGIVEGTNSSLEWDELDLKASQFTKLFERKEVPDACYQEMNMGSAN